MTEPSNAELSHRIAEVVRLTGIDMTRMEQRLATVESEQRTSIATADSKYVSREVYNNAIADLKTDVADQKVELKELKTTLDNNRRLVLTSLVMPIIVALFVAYVLTQVN